MSTSPPVSLDALGQAGRRNGDAQSRVELRLSALSGRAIHTSAGTGRQPMKGSAVSTQKSAWDAPPARACDRRSMPAHDVDSPRLPLDQPRSHQAVKLPPGNSVCFQIDWAHDSELPDGPQDPIVARGSHGEVHDTKRRGLCAIPDVMIASRARPSGHETSAVACKCRRFAAQGRAPRHLGQHPKDFRLDTADTPLGFHPHDVPIGNLKTNRPVGASQVTAIVRQVQTELREQGTSYRAVIRTTLALS